MFLLFEVLWLIYFDFGIDIFEYNGDELFELFVLVIFVIVSDGIVYYVFVNVDYC